MSRLLLLFTFCCLVIATARPLYAQEEKTVWVRITDARGNPLPNITVSTVEWGKAVTTTSSGKAGVPVPNTSEIDNEIHLIILSRTYRTANGLPVPIRISGFNKPYRLSEIILVPKAPSLPSRSGSSKPAYANTELDPFSKGEQAVAAQRYQEALHYFSKAYEERKQAYVRNKSLRVKAKYVEATRKLAELFTVVNKWRDAVDKFQELLRVIPSDDEASYYLGLCAMMLGDLPRAEKIFRAMKNSSRKPMSRQLGGMMTTAIHEAYGKLDDSLGLDQEFFQQLSERGIFTVPDVSNLFKLVSKVALDSVRGESYPSRIYPISNLALSITYKAQLTLAEKKEGQYSPAILTPVTDLANILQTQERYAEAEKLRIRAMTLEQRLFGDDYLSVGFSMMRVAELEAQRNSYVAAEKHYHEAAAILEKSLGKDTNFLTLVHAGLAHLFVRQARFQDAEHELTSVIEISCKPDTPDSMECIGALGQLSEFYSDRERYADAVAPLRQAIDISKKLWAAKDSVGTAIILEQIEDLEGLYEHTGNKQELESLKKEREYIAGLGVPPKEEPTLWNSDQATTATRLNGHRCSFQADDDYVKYPKSKELLEASLRVGKYLDYRDPDLNQVMYLLAYSYYTENRLDEAFNLAEKALKANEDSLQPNRSKTALLLNLKAGVSFDRGNYVQAEKSGSDALKTMQVVMGQNDQATVPFLMNLARIQRQRLNYVEAEKNISLALNIRESAADDTPSCAVPDSVDIASELAGLYVVMQRYPDAEKLFKDVLRAIGDCCLTNYYGAAIILENYAECLRRMGRNDEAVKLDARAKQLKPKE